MEHCCSPIQFNVLWLVCIRWSRDRCGRRLMWRIFFVGDIFKTCTICWILHTHTCTLKLKNWNHWTSTQILKVQDYLYKQHRSWINHVFGLNCFSLASTLITSKQNRYATNVILHPECDSSQMGVFCVVHCFHKLN